jgi:2-oxoglutarate dehydrogenase complex dehydrogenase (E1) component-like enzyme
MGKVRAIQDYTTKNDSVLGVLIHGDAAFAG